MDNKHNPLYLGHRGEHRVIEKLISLGHCPCVPVIDIGVDLILSTGTRLQIKATEKPSKHWRYPEGTYLWQLSPGQRITKGTVSSRPPRDISKLSDFVILWAADSDRFWIFPSALLSGRHTVTISTSRQWVGVDVERAKNMLSSGMGISQVAKELGVVRQTLMRRLNGTYSIPKRNFLSHWEYENRWELIGSYSRTISEAELPVPEPEIKVDWEIKQ